MRQRSGKLLGKVKLNFNMLIIEKIMEVVNSDKPPTTAILMLLIGEMKIIKLLKVAIFIAFTVFLTVGSLKLLPIIFGYFTH